MCNPSISAFRRRGGVIIGLIPRVFVVLGLLLAAGCAPTAATINVPADISFPVEAPAYHEGERWIFRTTREGGVSEEFSVLSPARRRPAGNRSFEGNEEADILDDALWATVYFDRSAVKSFDFPLTAGKQWAYRYPSFGGGRLRDAEVIVIGPAPQAIRTVAGEFRTIEIRRVETWRNVERTSVYFYSPETKSVVKLEANACGLDGRRRFEMELVNYFGAE